MVSEPIPDPFKGSPTIVVHAPSSRSVRREGVYWEKHPSPTLARDRAGQPSPLELAFGVELSLNSHS